MPMYEYKCPACDAHFEKLLPYSQADSVSCDACHVTAERIISRFGTGGGKAAQAAAMASASSPAARRAGGGHTCGHGCSH